MSVEWCERGAIVMWCKCGVSMVQAERFCVQASPDAFSLSCSLGTDTHKIQQRKRESQDGQTHGYICWNQSVRHTDRRRSS